jgi:hypothetical protein
MFLEQRKQFLGLLIACILNFHESSLSDHTFRRERSKHVNPIR